MLNEPLKILVRRSTSRFLETGLLILAVALGIGAASAGLSLMVNTLKSSAEMLASPDYREIVVSTASEAGEMEKPVNLKAVSETAVLSSADLDASAMAPAVAYGYVKNRSRMNFINEESIERDQKRHEEMGDNALPGNPPGDMEGGAENSEAPPGEDMGTFRPPEQIDLQDYTGEEGILIVDLEEASGYEVTNGFFDAWGLTPAYGSLFSREELTGTASVTVLGADLAEDILPEGYGLSDLVGKKILTREGLVTIIAVLEKGSDANNRAFFSPYQSDGGRIFFRRMFMNTQLRFTVNDPKDLDETALQLQSWFDSRYGDQQIVISNPRSEALQLVRRNTGIGVLILFLSLASLFIASVNVSNLLLSRSLRMKQQVGILMALGASRKDVFSLFFWEAAGIVLLGAILGTIFSIPLESYMSQALEITGQKWIFTLPGVLFSGFLTLSFSLFPSRQFSRIDPAPAMRAV